MYNSTCKTWFLKTFLRGSTVNVPSNDMYLQEAGRVHQAPWSFYSSYGPDTLTWDPPKFVVWE